MDNILTDKTLISLLSRQNLGVLATVGEEYPYTSLVGFAAAPDFKSLLFATMRGTRKYTYLEKHPKVTILIHSAANTPNDFKDAASVTVLGTTRDTQGADKKKMEKIFLKKFPFLASFLSDPSCALVRVDIEKFIVVTRFQEVREIEVVK